MPRTTRDDRVRPLLWLLPLVIFFLVAILCLKYLDDRLAADHRNGAASQAARTGALLENALGHRVSLLHTLDLLLAKASNAAEARARFATFGEELANIAPDVIAVYHLDASGAVRDVYPPDGRDGELVGDNHLLLSEHGEALLQSRRSGSAASTGLVPLRPDTLGLMIYEPILREGRAVGYVASAIAYAELLRSALGASSGEGFGYRITDSAGTVLGVSSQYPKRVAGFESREIALPGGHSWKLDVAVKPFEPRIARVLMWSVGLILLFIVFLLVVREDARAERIAMHSFSLELLSRNLLDANVRLEERAQQIEEANQAKSRFLANVSHELRTPLNAILGYNSLAMSGLYGDVAPSLHSAHTRIQAAADHLLGLVNDVLDLSKIEVGRMEVTLAQVDLEALLNNVLTVVEPIADAKGVRIDLVVARDLPVVTTDPRHLRQVVLNLASNAIKFTERGSVTMVARRGDGLESDSIRIDVEDTGIGIADEDLGRIFDEFEQVRPEGRGDSQHRGTGLGLTISRRLARLLGGDVIASSNIGSGSRFTVLLPIRPPLSGRPLGPTELAVEDVIRAGPSTEEERPIVVEADGTIPAEQARPVAPSDPLDDRPPDSPRRGR